MSPTRIDTGLLKWRYNGVNWMLGSDGVTWVNAANGLEADKMTSDALDNAERELTEDTDDYE